MAKEKINLVDVTLRDGMHAVSHQFTAATMACLAAKIDEIGYESFEFGHGNGLAGSSLQYGFAASGDEEYLREVSHVVHNTQMCIVIIPGIGTRYELEIARENGVEVARIATQITECDIGKQHIAMAREMGFHTRTLLPHAAPLSVEDTVKYAILSAQLGSQVVYILDGGGAMLPGEVYERVSRARDATEKYDAKIGFHGTTTCRWRWLTPWRRFAAVLPISIPASRALARAPVTAPLSRLSRSSKRWIMTRALICTRRWI